MRMAIWEAIVGCPKASGGGVEVGWWGVYKRIMLKQPDTKVKMTNVATIRYKINNRNFEIACYRNKAVNWRNGLEEDIS